MPKNHDEEVLQGAFSLVKDIFAASNQGMYLFWNDDHAVCNANFSKMLGYKSPDEWSRVSESFLQDYVAPNSQDSIVTAYQNAMKEKRGSMVAVSWKKKDGSTVQTNVILVPMSYQGHMLALHFIEKK